MCYNATGHITCTKAPKYWNDYKQGKITSFDTEAFEALREKEREEKIAKNERKKLQEEIRRSHKEAEEANTQTSQRSSQNKKNVNIEVKVVFINFERFYHNFVS